MRVQRDRRCDSPGEGEAGALVEKFAVPRAACNDPTTMRHLRIRASAMSIGLVTLLVSGTAVAKRHTIERGETLNHIARAYNCSVEEIQRANGIDTTLIRAGSTLRIPTCKQPRKVAVTSARRERTGTDDGRKRARRKEIVVAPVTGQSVGAPWDGELVDGVRLHLGAGFKIRRPHRAWGASHVVAQVERALLAVRDRFPEAHTLAIGDLSAREGGAITEHRSHQSGRDVDIGLYFTRVPDGYPSSFVGANTDLDLRKTWALLQAFAKTADDPAGVQKIYLDFAVQGRLYKWAKDHDVPRGYLDALFQYPHGRGASKGLVRHEPHHDDHLHVRFKCAPDDDSCR
jgi:murein endopeptidase